ncbi:MAG: hypothetical protein J6X28_02965 [Bacilli bacterium]|nr:hypothetical protein [Bacilli bacterium]
MHNCKKKIFIFLFVGIILFLTIGYALLTSQLTINGSSVIQDTRWDIHFENLVVKEESAPLTEGDYPAEINASNNTLITYTITLQLPGDFYEFTVDVSNAGTIPGKVSVVSLTGIDSAYENIVDYSTRYTYAYDVQTGDLLNPGSKKNLTVRVEYKKDITSSDLPSSDLTLNLQFSVTYIQSDTLETQWTYVLPEDTNSYPAKGKTNHPVVLPAGTEVTILSIVDNWVNIETEDGQNRWLFIWLSDGLADTIGVQNTGQRMVVIFSDRQSVMVEGRIIHLTSYVQGFDGYTLYYQWECDKGDGNGFQEIEGANEDHYEYPANQDTLSWDYRLMVYFA